PPGLVVLPVPVPDPAGLPLVPVVLLRQRLLDGRVAPLWTHRPQQPAADGGRVRRVGAHPGRLGRLVAPVVQHADEPLAADRVVTVLLVIGLPRFLPPAVDDPVEP